MDFSLKTSKLKRIKEGLCFNEEGSKKDIVDKLWIKYNIKCLGFWMGLDWDGAVCIDGMELQVGVETASKQD